MKHTLELLRKYNKRHNTAYWLFIDEEETGSVGMDPDYDVDFDFKSITELHQMLKA